MVKMETDDPVEKQVDNSACVMAKLTKLYREQFMSDVCLTVNGAARYPAHRLLLSASSSVFHVMLASTRWRDSAESTVDLEEEPACADVFAEFLQYFYSGKIRLDCNTAMAVLMLSDKYDVKDLVKLCVDYMCTHVAHASVNNRLVSWMQYSVTCGHEQVAEACKRFVKWNIEEIAGTQDFANFESDLFIALLQQNDLVVNDEFRLYKIVVRWLQLQEQRIIWCGINNGLPAEEVAERVSAHLRPLTLDVMSQIRFPMMLPQQLAELLLSDVVREFQDFFMERMAVGMCYHKMEVSSMARLHAAAAAPNGHLLFTPRLYTADSYSAQLVIEKVHAIPPFHTSTLLFSSHAGRHPRGGTAPPTDNNLDWVVDVFPKGVCFRKCWLIVWQGSMEVPEHVLRTVRVSVSGRTGGSCVRVKVGILIVGVRDNIEHVASVVERYHQFDENSPTLNFDDLLDFDALNAAPTPAAPKCPFLVGPASDTLKLNIVIVPLNEFSATASPAFRQR